MKTQKAIRKMKRRRRYCWVIMDLTVPTLMAKIILQKNTCLESKMKRKRSRRTKPIMSKRFKNSDCQKFREKCELWKKRIDNGRVEVWSTDYEDEEVGKPNHGNVLLLTLLMQV